MCRAFSASASVVQIRWILECQVALARACGKEDSSLRDYGFVEEGEQQYFGRDDVPRSVAKGGAPPTQPRNVDEGDRTADSYNAAAEGREAARAKNRGSGIF
jgi:hypothetical protein